MRVKERERRDYIISFDKINQKNIFKIEHVKNTRKEEKKKSFIF